MCLRVGKRRVRIWPRFNRGTSFSASSSIELAEILALTPETKARADALYRDTIRRFPNHEGLLTSLAQTCMQWGEFRRARRVIVDRLLVIAPQTVTHRGALEFVDRKIAAMKNWARNPVERSDSGSWGRFPVRRALRGDLG